MRVSQRYVAKPSFSELSREQKKAKLQKAWAIYSEGFRNEFFPPDTETDEDKEAWRQTVKEQSSAAREVYNEAQQSPATAKAYFGEWIAIYRNTLKAFTAGYNDGKSGVPLPADARLKITTPFDGVGAQKGARESVDFSSGSEHGAPIANADNGGRNDAPLNSKGAASEPAPEPAPAPGSEPSPLSSSRTGSAAFENALSALDEQQQGSTKPSHADPKQ